MQNIYIQYIFVIDNVPDVAQLIVETDFPITYNDFIHSKNWVLPAPGHLDKQVFRNQARKVSVSIYVFLSLL